MIDWTILQEMRDIFLGRKPESIVDYWQSPEQFKAYDATFGARIGWKWEYVLKEAKKREWTPSSPYTLWDWGCGTGIATQTFLEALSERPPEKIFLWDKSKPVSQFAGEKIRTALPDLSVHVVDDLLKFGEANSVLLISHVLNELSDGALAELKSLITKAATVLWVEPGTPFHSKGLIEVRQARDPQLHIVAPCPHEKRCGLLGSERDWCHHFAPVPSTVFQSRIWAEFSRKMGIDLRSLPLSYLILDKGSKTYGLPFRTIGRARVRKGFAERLVCKESGVSVEKILQRENPELYRRLKKQD